LKGSGRSGKEVRAQGARSRVHVPGSRVQSSELRVDRVGNRDGPWCRVRYAACVAFRFIWRLNPVSPQTRAPPYRQDDEDEFTGVAYSKWTTKQAEPGENRSVSGVGRLMIGS